VQLSVGLVVNSYERTYRDVLRPGYFTEVIASNLRPVDEVVALINNVRDPADARERAEALVQAGEISSYAFVRDHIAAALAQARLPVRALRRRPYLLDYGLVMPHVISTTWLLGWDAETRLGTPTNWIDPSIDLMESDPRVFHTSLNWRPLGPDDPGLDAETVELSGPFALNWGFSDQLFLLRRTDLAGPVFRSFAPAAIVRHAPHPYTFEYRVESHQRATRRFRATLKDVYYETNTIPGGVLARTGRSARDRLQIRVLRSIEFHVVDRLPKAMGPRFRKS
jgi:hypothetical protein